MTVGTKLFTFLFSKHVGTDEFGNKYYISRCKDSAVIQRRSVIYKGLAEPTKIPPMWHAWLNYSSDALPTYIQEYSWQKSNEPNGTGTLYATYPDGHPLSAKKSRSKVSADYQSWEYK